MEGGNAQALHGLVNYGLISIGSGAEVIINAQTATGTTLANFYNAGWIVDNGGTLVINSSVFDGSSTIAAGSTPDGYIIIENAGDVVLGNTVATHEEVSFGTPRRTRCR